MNAHRPGHKQTDAGVIPEDWDAAQLGQIGRFKNGINKPKEAFGSGFPFVNLMDVFGVPKIGTDAELDCLQASVAERNTYDLRAGDVLFIRSSVKPSGVGLTTLIEDDLKDTVFSGFLLRFRDGGKLEHSFKEFCFYDKRFRESIIANSTVSANTNINQSSLKKLWLAVPRSGDEQLAIAAALRDADALIASLDALIAKKRDLKQAAMQQLLTGKTRLPGFAPTNPRFQPTEIGTIPYDWSLSTVGEEFDIQLGKMLDIEKNTGFLKPYLGNRAVQWDRINTSDLPMVAMTSTDLSRFRLRLNDLLVCEGGEVGRAAIWDAPLEECYFQKALQRLRPRRGFNARLMIAILRSWSDRGILANFVTQTSIAHLPKDKFALVPLPVPSPAEQLAIATVLSDTDADIAALESKRNKTHAVKQGMMQELLTGRIRLV
jgi:type I restriction enzyme, S subunit